MAGKERSRSYPGINLSEAVQHAHKIDDQLGKGFHDRESITKAMGYESFNGNIGRKIGALVQYGLLDRTGDTYALTELSRSITVHRNEQERMEAIRVAFGRPAFYKELIERYRSEGALPKQLPNILVRDHGIIKSSADDAARLFLQSGQFAGLLTAEGRFIPPSTSEVQQQKQDPKKASERDGLGSEQIQPGELEEVDAVATEAQVPTGNQKFVFALTERKFATIIVPAQLKTRDVQIIKKQIELLELQTED